MTYTPTEWKNGDIVTSAKLNNIEQGIVSGSGLIEVDDATGELNVSYNDVMAMLSNGVVPFAISASQDEGSIISVIGYAQEDGSYIVAFAAAGGEPAYAVAETADAHLSVHAPAPDPTPPDNDGGSGGGGGGDI